MPDKKTPPASAARKAAEKRFNRMVDSVQVVQGPDKFPMPTWEETSKLLKQFPDEVLNAGRTITSGTGAPSAGPSYPRHLRPSQEWKVPRSVADAIDTVEVLDPKTGRVMAQGASKAAPTVVAKAPGFFSKMLPFLKRAGKIAPVVGGVLAAGDILAPAAEAAGLAPQGTARTPGLLDMGPGPALMQMAGEQDAGRDFSQIGKGHGLADIIYQSLARQGVRNQLK